MKEIYYKISNVKELMMIDDKLYHGIVLGKIKKIINLFGTDFEYSKISFKDSRLRNPIEIEISQRKKEGFVLKTW